MSEIPERTNTNYIETASGKKFWTLNPIVDDIDIMDIAHALANKCRFTGHCKRFYSIAQHSVLVSQLVSDIYALEGLLHDAAEAYMPDLAYPLRGGFCNWEEIENRVHTAIAKRFRLIHPYPVEVNIVDRKIVRDEAWSLMHSQGKDWPGSREKFGMRVRPWSAEESKERFVEQFQTILESGREIPDPWHFHAIMRERQNDKK